MNVRGPSMYPLAIAAVLALLTGCTYNVGVSRFDTKPLIKKRNITVGVYYSQEFRDSVHAEKRGLNNMNIPIGKASTRMLDEVFASAFHRVVNILEWPVDATNLPEVDLVIEPTLEAFSVTYSRSGYKDVFSIEINYQIKFFSADGKILGSHKLLGEGRRFVGFDILKPHPLSDATERAIRDAAAKISVAIETDEKIGRWLRTSEPVIYSGKEGITRHVESQKKVPPALPGQPDDGKGGQQ